MFKITFITRGDDECKELCSDNKNLLKRTLEALVHEEGSDIHCGLLWVKRADGCNDVLEEYSGYKKEWSTDC